MGSATCVSWACQIRPGGKNLNDSCKGTSAFLDRLSDTSTFSTEAAGPAHVVHQLLVNSVCWFQALRGDLESPLMFRSLLKVKHNVGLFVCLWQEEKNQNACLLVYTKPWKELCLPKEFPHFSLKCTFKVSFVGGRKITCSCEVHCKHTAFCTQ